MALLILYSVGVVNALVFLFWDYGYAVRTWRERASMFGMACVWPALVYARWRKRG